jgi:peptide deformylase
MSVLSIVYAPNPVFKQKAKPVDKIDDLIHQLAEDMLDTMYFEKAVGIGANMLGIDQRIIVVDTKQENNKSYVMINPEIIETSTELSEHEEASLSFPGISAIIKRPNKIKVKFLDLDNKEQVLEAEGFLARVILHENDYLNGITYLDHLSKMKRDMLTKKMIKHIKHHPPHIHGKHCNH